MGDNQCCTVVKTLCYSLEFFAHLCVIYLFVHHVLGVYGQENGEDLLLAYDCRDTKHLLGLDIDEPRCQGEHTYSKVSPVRYQVLKRKPPQFFKGWSCRVVLLPVPNSCLPEVLTPEETPIPVSPDLCRSMWELQRYQDPTEGVHSLFRNQDNLVIMPVNSSNQTCFPAQVVTSLDLLDLSSVPNVRAVRIWLQEEAFIPKTYGIEAFGDKDWLPCPSWRRGCETSSRTYGWERAVNECPLRLLIHPKWEERRLIAASQESPMKEILEKYEESALEYSTGIQVHGADDQQVFISNDGFQIRVLLTGEASACGRTLLTTNDPDLFLRAVTGNTRFPKEVVPPEISISRVRAQASDFYFLPRDDGTYRTETIQREYTHVLNNHCRYAGTDHTRSPWIHKDDPGVTAWNLGPGFYAQGSGDMVCQYHCPQRYVQVRKASLCYHALPVQEVGIQRRIEEEIIMQVRPHAMFLEPFTYKLIHNGFQVSCNSSFVPHYINLNGRRIKANPSLQLDDNSSSNVTEEVMDTPILGNEVREEGPALDTLISFHRPSPEGLASEVPPSGRNVTANHHEGPVFPGRIPFLAFAVLGIYVSLRTISLLVSWSRKYRILRQLEGPYRALWLMLSVDVYLLQRLRQATDPVELKEFHLDINDAELEPQIPVNPSSLE